jgi:hypothetical protein
VQEFDRLIRMGRVEEAVKNLTLIVCRIEQEWCCWKRKEQALDSKKMVYGLGGRAGAAGVGQARKLEKICQMKPMAAGC